MQLGLADWEVDYQSEEAIAMNIIVLQHAEAEHLGIFRLFLDQDGHSWKTFHL